MTALDSITRVTSDTSKAGRKATQAEPTITVERDGDIAIFWLNRPDRLNAFMVQMGEELRAAFDETDADDSVRAVVLTGTGRAFCAGADLEEGGSTFDASSEVAGDEVPADEGGKLTMRMFASLKPIVAAINGPSAGVGVTMTLPADVRIASEDAKFGFVFAARGLVPEAASSWFPATRRPADRSAVDDRRQDGAGRRGARARTDLSRSCRRTRSSRPRSPWRAR